MKSLINQITFISSGWQSRKRSTCRDHQFIFVACVVNFKADSKKIKDILVLLQSISLCLLMLRCSENKTIKYCFPYFLLILSYCVIKLQSLFQTINKILFLFNPAHGLLNHCERSKQNRCSVSQLHIWGKSLHSISWFS